MPAFPLMQLLCTVEVQKHLLKSTDDKCRGEEDSNCERVLITYV
jgi:hypothetical protein